MPVTCRHPHSQTWKSENQEGYWAQCEICGSYTAVFDDKEEARKALVRMKRLRPSPKSANKVGRPKTLPEDAKLRTFMLCESHIKTLEIYKRHNKLGSRSDALRHWLENGSPKGANA